MHIILHALYNVSL